MNTQLAAWTFPVLGLLGLTAITACQPSVDSKDDASVATAPPTVTSQDFGDYVVHFTALRTDQLTPSIATDYGIIRSANRAMLNVSVIKKSPGHLGTPVLADVKVSAANLSAQLKRTNIKEIREGDAIYYIAEIPVANSEILTFNIEVTPENETEPLLVRFQKQFFTD